MSAFTPEQLEQFEQLIRKVVREELRTAGAAGATSPATRKKLTDAAVERLLETELPRIAEYIVDKHPERLLKGLFDVVLQRLKQSR